MIEHYNAFISYKHAPLDTKVASEIQTRLERFRIPKTIRKTRGIQKIDRIFRDKGELLITSDLNETIEHALVNSDFLIVICSHATKESIWVQREIEFFLKTHSKNQVLTVVAEGEPVDVVPQILQERQVTVTLDDGSEEVVTVPMEPLSCDYRGDFRKARKEELPRLVAAMLGCSYDELKQRQRQYRMRRLTAVFSAVAVGLAALSVYFAWSASQIKENYILSLQNQSQYLAAESVALLESGDRMNAMLLALEALPKDDKDERPVLPEAEYALAQAVNAYVSTNENQYSVEYAFPHGGKINKILPSQDEKYLTVLHSDYAFTLWDVQTREKIHEQMFVAPILDAALSNEENLLLLSGDTLSGFDSHNGEILWQLEVDTGTDTFAASETASIAAVSIDAYLMTVDTATGQVLQKVDLPTYEAEDADTGEIMAKPYRLQYAKFSPDNRSVFLHLCGDSAWLALWDLKTNTICLWDMWFFSVDDAFFTEDGNIVMMGKYRYRNGNYQIGTLYYYEDDYTEICCFSPDSKLLWADEIHYTEMDLGLGSECVPFTYQSEDGGIAAVAAAAGEKLNFYDITTGEILEENAYTNAIVTLTDTDTHLSAITTDGMVGKYNFDEKINSAGDFCIDGIDLAWEKEKLFVSSAETGNVLLYTYGLHDENWTQMPMDEQIESDWTRRFIKYTAGSKTLVTYERNRSLEEFFVVLDGETRTVRYYDGLADVFTGDDVVDKKYVLGFSPDGSKLLMIHGNDLIDILESMTITQAQSLSTQTYEDAFQQLDYFPDLIAMIYQNLYKESDTPIAALDLETGEFIPDYDALPSGWSDLVFQDEAVYFRANLTDDSGNACQGVMRRLPDGSFDSVVIPTATPEAYLISDALWVAEAEILIREHDYEADTRRYCTANMQTKEVFHTDPIAYEDTTALWSADGEVFFVTEENCIIAFDHQCKELYRIPCNGMTAESLFASGEDLFVLYGVDKVYRYRVSDGTFLNKIDVDAGSVVRSDCRWDNSKDGTLALFNNNTLNLIDTQRWVVRTHVADCLGFDLQENLVFTTMSKKSEPMKFGYYEIYNYKQLIDMAKQQLEGMTLSTEMRAKYGLQ